MRTISYTHQTEEKCKLNIYAFLLKKEKQNKKELMYTAKRFKEQLSLLLWGAYDPNRCNLVSTHYFLSLVSTQ